MFINLNTFICGYRQKSGIESILLDIVMKRCYPSHRGKSIDVPASYVTLANSNQRMPARFSSVRVRVDLAEETLSAAKNVLESKFSSLLRASLSF